MSKHLDDTKALWHWLESKHDDNGLDYLSNITAYIAELKATNNSVRVCRGHTSEIADPLRHDCLICRIAELEATFKRLVEMHRTGDKLGLRDELQKLSKTAR